MDYYVYILTNKNNTVLYVGVTNDIYRRVNEHKQKLIEGFSKRYNLDKLVYCEKFKDIKEAIQREKTLKKWARVKKENLISLSNPTWSDLL